MKYCFQLIIIVAGAIGLFMINCSRVFVNSYETDYFRKVGIKKTLFYNDVIKSLGRPESEKVERKKADWLYASYRDCRLTFKKNANESKSKYFLMNVRMLTSKYKFGEDEIGIGSNLEAVKKAYGRVPIIKDANSVGYVDGDTRVVFSFNHEKKVSSILLCYGP
ncbi:MAG TPA: hypothetical protein VHY08_25785 [Bacillota bacterium]|nr:hypothetical protein [Bacillota bacterium]